MRLWGWQRLVAANGILQEMIEHSGQFGGTLTDSTQQETDMAEQEWIDWHPKVGDVRPEGYQYHNGYRWVFGVEDGRAVNALDASGTKYRIPAPKPAEARPPWIDPQCKFRWGDRVKVLTTSRVGKVAYVVNPHDLSDTGYGDASWQYTVLVATSLSAAAPYETAGNLHRRGKWLANYALDRVPEDDLELCPEDLPQHFDDRLLDADGPQETTKYGSFVAILNDRFPEMWEKALRKAYGPLPRDIWVNEYPSCFGRAFTSYEAAKEGCDAGYIRTVHFREVL